QLDVRRVALDPDLLIDVDTPAQLAELAGLSSRGGAPSPSPLPPRGCPWGHSPGALGASVSRGGAAPTPMKVARVAQSARHAPSLPVGAFDLARAGPRADARDVRLRHAEHVVDPRRPDTEAGRRAGRDRVRRGDEGIGAVIQVEQRRLRALAQHAFAGVERLV